MALKILPGKECAVRALISLRQWQRILARGDGPPIVEISAQRSGCIESDFEEWVRSRRRRRAPRDKAQDEKEEV